MSSSNTPIADGRPLPGDLAIWVFIMAELLVFAVFFMVFAWVKHQHMLQFQTLQLQLHRNWGLLNTLFLLSGSFAMAEAAHRQNQGHKRSDILITMMFALACGIGFVFMKLHEFAVDTQTGMTLSSSLFATFYWCMTFFHFMHVLLGLTIIAIVTYKVAFLELPEHYSGIDTVASYWHMVDLVWLILFLQLYVLI